MSCSTFQPVDPASRSDCGDVWAPDIDAGHRKNDPIRTKAGSLNDTLPLFFPKIIKVEPIVGRQTAVVFQSVGVTLGPLLNLHVSMPSVDRHLIGEQFEMNLVAIPSAVKPEEEHDRH